MKVTSGSSPAPKYSSAIRISPIIYFLISVGVALQISGSNWDIVWHGIGNVETFFTPPHSVIYSGVVLVIGSVVVGIIHTTKILQQKNIRSKKNILGLLTVSLPLSIKLAVIGCTLQLTAGPFDFWWHSQFGFDGLLSPPHSVLATGMLMAALGALIGIYYHYRDQNNNNNNSTSCSIFSRLSLILAFAVFLLVGVGIVLMFTLPFSKGQYFDFNPNPLAAVVAASTFIPFIIGLCLFVAVKISAFSTNNKRIPFMLTSIIAVIMIIQSTTTITSNSYFAWLFPLYLLNILPAIVADILIYSYLQKKKDEISITSSSSSSYSSQSFSSNSKIANPNNNTTTIKLCLIASIIVSTFYTTLFFPWTVDVYGGYFKPPNTLRTEEFFVQLLIPVILPIAVPVSILSSMTGGLVGQKLMNIGKSIG